MNARFPWQAGSLRTSLIKTHQRWRRPRSLVPRWRHTVLPLLLSLLLLLLPVLWVLWMMRMPALLAAGIPTPARNATTQPSAPHAGFPRLLGMNIGDKNYDEPGYQRQLARLDIAILGFYRGWGNAETGASMRDVVRNLKRLHPGMLVGQYTVLNEASNDPANTAENDKQATLSRHGWWLRDAAGDRVQWTSRYQAWETNVTGWTSPDTKGRRYAEWLAERDFAVFFQPVPEFDIWYFDNVMDHQRIGAADWQGRGRDDAGTDTEISQAFRVGQSRHWQAAHLLAPALTMMGNPDNDLSSPEYRGRLQAAFLEGLMGQRWRSTNAAAGAP